MLLPDLCLTLWILILLRFPFRLTYAVLLAFTFSRSALTDGRSEDIIFSAVFLSVSLA